MAVEGRWRTYSITLAWFAYDETLRMVCTFEMEPPAHKHGVLFEALNEINDQCWAGAFTYWTEQSLMVYRVWVVIVWRASRQRRSNKHINFVSSCHVRAVLPSLSTGGLWRSFGERCDASGYCRGVRGGPKLSPCFGQSAHRGGLWVFQILRSVVWCCLAAEKWDQRCWRGG